MEFRYPLLLLLLPLVVVPLAFWLWRGKNTKVVLPFDHSPAVDRKWLRFSILVAQTFPVILLAVVVVILAGPIRLTQPQHKRAMTNIEFCVDISGSMTAKFGGGTRYDASMEAIDEFLDFRKGDAFGLTFFGNSVMHWVPLTNDASAIRCSPPFMRPERAPRGFGGTEIGKALLACRSVLVQREEGDRMIILVSDGNSFDLSDGNDAKIARRLKESDIVVYAIHIGGSQTPDEIVNVTSLTGGEVFEAGDPGGLIYIFQKIDEMQQAELEKIAPQSVDHYGRWSLAGLAMIALTSLCQFVLRFTPW